MVPHHAQLLDQWAALGGVPEDQATRDFACELLLKVWADRQMWVGLAMELTELHGPFVPDQDASHVELGGRISAPAAQLAVPGGLAQSIRLTFPRGDAAAAATPTPSAAQATPTPENADSRSTPATERPAVQREEQ